MIPPMIIKFALIFLAIFGIIFLLLPDFFPYTNIDEAFLTILVLAVLKKLGITI